MAAAALEARHGSGGGGRASVGNHAKTEFICYDSSSGGALAAQEPTAIFAHERAAERLRRSRKLVDPYEMLREEDM
jgi:hypothetical protein